jgi:DNA-binding response OmpR family regulator
MTQENNKKKILVIEDEPIIRRVCARILAAGNYAVDIAESGSQASKMIENEDYDICLSDVRLPEMDGMNFYRLLRESHPLLAEKTIFMTGDCISTDIKTFLEETGSKCILKPFTPDELSAAVEEIE